MTFENLEEKSLQSVPLDGIKLKELNKSIENQFEEPPLEAKNGFFENLSDASDSGIAAWLKVSGIEIVSGNRVEAYRIIRSMFSPENAKMLGLDEISEWKINPDPAYKKSNIKQHAGYAAEVISTAKENIIAELNENGIKTVRTDDLAKIDPNKGYTVNDPYVDKVRIDSDGNIVERIQTKFVGKTAEKCLEKLASPKYEKYLNPNNVDKIEIPSDYFDEIKSELLPDKIKNLETQIESMKKTGNQDALNNAQAQLDKYKRIDEILEKSLVSNKDAIDAVKHPKIYKAKTMVQNVVETSNKAGLETAKYSAGLTFAISAVDNISQYYSGEIDADDAIVNIIEESGTSALVGYGTGFATAGLQTVMEGSSKALIQKAGNSCLPAAAVSFAVESYDEVAAYLKGEIDEYELAEALGEDGAKVAGGIAGASLGTKAGAAIGTAIAPGVGTAVGAAVGGVVGGIVGGMVGATVAVEAYNQAVDYVKDHSDEIKDIANSGLETVNQKIDQLEDVAQKCAENVIVNVAKTAPEAVESVKTAFSDFSKNMKLPFTLGQR